MARFNTVTPEQRVLNEAGGLGFEKNPKLELALLVLTSFAKDQFYRDASAQVKRVGELVPLVGTEFAAKAALYARREAGMRSITHVLAAEVAKASKREAWLRSFFARIARRPDDILEILSLLAKPSPKKTKGGKAAGLRKLPKAVQKGLADGFGQFDKYQLSKYRAEGKQVSLVDAVRVLHVKPTERNADALKLLIEGKLVSDSTWESKLTKAGQKAKAKAAETGQSQEEAALELKAEAWADLLGRKQLGYFALLRNLRNIMQQAPDALPTALADLVDEGAIRRSLVMPFRFQSAYDELRTLAGTQEILRALSKAATIAVSNMPALPGRTLIALDKSGSMSGTMDWSSQPGPGSPFAIGKMFASAMVLKGASDLILWSTDVEVVSINPDVPVLDAASQIGKNFGGGTNMGLVFAFLKRQLELNKVRYDRVIILTDNQSWEGDTLEGRAAYLKAAGGKAPNVWVWDLQGYSTLQMKENQTFIIGGFSDKALGLIAKMESDPQALVNEIEQVSLVKVPAPEADTEQAPAS